MHKGHLLSSEIASQVAWNPGPSSMFSDSTRTQPSCHLESATWDHDWSFQPVPKSGTVQISHLEGWCFSHKNQDTVSDQLWGTQGNGTCKFRIFLKKSDSLKHCDPLRATEIIKEKENPDSFVLNKKTAG